MTTWLEMVERVLAETGLAPQYLKLEITEGLVMHSDDATVNTLRHLQKLGVHIAMDDFGTGYSSLSYLNASPSTHSRSTSRSCTDCPMIRMMSPLSAPSSAWRSASTGW